MRIRSGVFLTMCVLLSVSPAFADDPAYVRATATVKDADADVAKNGTQAIASHVVALEKALADGAADFPPKPGADGKLVMLTDGPLESMQAMAQSIRQVVEGGTPTGAVAVPDPYPEAGLLLAFYYNEAGKPQDALRVIAITLQRESVQGAHIGLRMARIFAEQAAAYDTLKRWDDALAAGDAGVKAAQNDRDKATNQRARGFALTELGRLDDAEAAYNESLKLAPGNATAQRELAYIAQLRAGGPKAPTGISLPGAPPKAQ